MKIKRSLNNKPDPTFVDEAYVHILSIMQELLYLNFKVSKEEIAHLDSIRTSTNQLYKQILKADEVMRK